MASMLPSPGTESSSGRASATATFKPDRPKRGTACERCNKRRVKCDGWINGLPCSECRKAKNEENCKLVKSKRTRGSDGRYIVPDEATDQQSHHPHLEHFESPPDMPETRQPMRSISEPDINHELARICGPEDSHSGATTPRMMQHRRASSFKETDARASFVGESWYASYVLAHSNSTTGYSELHRAREHAALDTPKVARPIPADLPPQNLTERLLEAYFTRFHVFCPIVDKAPFLASVRDRTVSITLLRSILFVASIHCKPETFHLMGYSTRMDAQDDLFNRACASFDADTESDRTTMVLSSYLLHYWFGKPTTYRDSLWWLATAIRSAQCMGYHRSTKDSKMSAEDKSRFRRIWWCFYIRDRQLCFSMGVPVVINDADYDVEELTMDDFPDDEAAIARYIILSVELNQAVSQMYFRHCSPRQLPLSKDSNIRAHARREIQSTMEGWLKKAQTWPLWNDGHQLSLLLKVIYFYYILNLQRRLQRLSPTTNPDLEGAAILFDASNNIAHFVEDSLLYWTPESFPLIYVSAIFSALIVHAERHKSTTIPEEQLSAKIRPYLLALKQFEQVYVLARWVRNLFMDMTGRRDRRDRRHSSLHQQRPAISTQSSSDSLLGRSSHISAPSQAASQQTQQLPPTSAFDTPNDYSGASNSNHYFSIPFQPDMDLGQFVGDFLPPFDVNGDEFYNARSASTVDMTGYPQPGSVEYQTIHFLTNLGLPTGGVESL